MPDDITRHLVSLDEAVLVQNMVSWEQALSKIETAIAKGTSRYWNATKLDFIRSLAHAEESRLFRVGISRVYLTISTSHKLGLERGEAFLRLIWNEQNSPVLEYCRFGKTSLQSYKLTSFDDPLNQMLPFLKRLWYEGRKKPADEELQP